MFNRSTFARLATKMLGFLFAATPFVGASASAQEARAPAASPSETMSAGVALRLKNGAKASAQEVASRNQVPFDEIKLDMFGNTKLSLKILVPFKESDAHAKRLRSDADVESAWADYFIESTLIRK